MHYNISLHAKIVVFLILTGTACQLLGSETDWHRSQLGSDSPDEEVLYLDIDGDGNPDLLERWWNGHRVRWLDENGDLQPGDVRGDQVMDALQIDVNEDGLYDGVADINIKWADLDGNGIPDMQAVVENNKTQGRSFKFSNRGQWMIFRNSDDRGVLGWMDWSDFSFDCWGHDGTCNWLPNYHGNTLFLKVHEQVGDLEDPTLNWENPFIFYDPDGDGLCEYAIRWVDSREWKRESNKLSFDGFMNEAYIAYDIDNDSGKDNESDFDFTLYGSGQPGLDYRNQVQDVTAFLGNPKFDDCFTENVWRRLDYLRYMPPETSYNALFNHPWEQMIFVFDEDDDDHRWERVELYLPTSRRWRTEIPVDVYALGRRAEDKLPGLSIHPQSDSIGDRGEFDMDNSGGGRLYIGPFDRKLHLAGAEWGAWTVDPEGEFHGGYLAPSPMPEADRVYEVVQYRDTDGNGFLDQITYDYDGDQTIDLQVNLLDYATESNPHPDVAELIDLRTLGWEGIHNAYNELAKASWKEALAVYRAAWRRGLTSPEIDRMASASSNAQRHAEGYWIKERIFRKIREHLASLPKNTQVNGDLIPSFEADLKRAYYLGHYEEYIKLIAKIPGSL